MNKKVSTSKDNFYYNWFGLTTDFLYRYFELLVTLFLIEPLLQSQKYSMIYHGSEVFYWGQDGARKKGGENLTRSFQPRTQGCLSTTLAQEVKYLILIGQSKRIIPGRKYSKVAKRKHCEDQLSSLWTVLWN